MAFPEFMGIQYKELKAFLYATMITATPHQESNTKNWKSVTLPRISIADVSRNPIQRIESEIRKWRDSWSGSGLGIQYKELKVHDSTRLQAIHTLNESNTKNWKLMLLTPVTLIHNNNGIQYKELKALVQLLDKRLGIHVVKNPIQRIERGGSHPTHPARGRESNTKNWKTGWQSQ